MSPSTATADIKATGHGAWLQPLRDWPDAVAQALQSEGAIARVVVATVRGSAPREAGTCMLVGRDTAHGTIGGGTLEWVAIDAARKMLADFSTPPASVQRLVLGADLAQCCGGVVDVWIERYIRDDREFVAQLSRTRKLGGGRLITRMRADRIERELQQLQSSRSSVQLDWPSPGNAVFSENLDAALPALWLYGAGHVGQALAKVLATLPMRTTWIDSRRDLLADELATVVDLRHAAAPEMTVADAPAGAHFIVMTHSHSLDYELCRNILERGDFASVGVIGSKSKAARFRSRLARDGLSPERIAQLRCPIGIDGLESKLPAVIAVAVAAQVLKDIERTLVVPLETEIQAATTCTATSCTTCGPLHRAS